MAEQEKQMLEKLKNHPQKDAILDAMIKKLKGSEYNT